MVQKQQDLIRLVKPNIDKKDIEKVIEVLESGNLVEGKYAAIFEKKLSRFTCIGNIATVSSATAGLHLLLLALGLQRGDSVIVPSFTFPATANVVENIGAEVILCDVDKHTYVVDPQVLEKTICAHLDKNIKAIMIVHEFGYPSNMQKISKIAAKYKLKLIEDGACALGTLSSGYHVGHFSDGVVFSFHPRKAITSGEGGAVASMHQEVIEKIKILKNHGIVRVDGKIDFVEAGLNYRLTDFQSALLLGQLERFKKEIQKRKALVHLYNQYLDKIDGITLPAYHEDHSWQSYMIVLDKKYNRQATIDFLLEHNIQSNLGAQSLNCLQYYKCKYNYKEGSFPNSELLYKQGLVLPLYGKLKEKDILRVVQTLKMFLSQA